MWVGCKWTMFNIPPCQTLTNHWVCCAHSQCAQEYSSALSCNPERHKASETTAGVFHTTCPTLIDRHKVDKRLKGYLLAEYWLLWWRSAYLGFLASAIHRRSMLQARTGMWGYCRVPRVLPGFPLVRRTSMMSWMLVSHRIGSPNRMTAGVSSRRTEGRFIQVWSNRWTLTNLNDFNYANKGREPTIYLR